MIGKLIEAVFVLIILYIIAVHAEPMARFVEASAGGAARLIQVLQGNVNAGAGT